MADVYLGLGSNVGDRLEYIKKSVERIRNTKEIKFIRCSSIYETEPWGFREQEYFLNCVIQVETDLPPAELLTELKKLEASLGRKNRKKWNKREIDIDILFYDDIVYKDEILEIPHSDIGKRKFVLIPMSEVSPGHIHPATGENILEMLNNTEDKSMVTKINKLIL